MSSESVVFPTHLLLLPPSPWPVSYKTINAAYATAITSTLTKLRSEFLHTTIGSCLDIVLPVPYLHQHQAQPRSTQYPIIQQLVASLYKLVCVVAAKHNINVEDAEGIDVRIVLLSYPRNGEGDSISHSTTTDLFGPVINLHTLTTSERPWKSVFSVESEEGEKLLRQFLINQNCHMKVNKVVGGTILVDTESDASDVALKTSMRHASVAVGGTWDHVHIGHKLLLTMTAFMLDPPDGNDGKAGKSLTIGITGDELLKNKKYVELVQVWEERQHSVVRFLKAIMDFRSQKNASFETTQRNEPISNGHAIHTRIAGGVVLKGVEINDPFGPTITDEEITALVVSGETRSGGKAVNEKRSEKGWRHLEVYEVDVLDAQDAPSGALGQITGETSFESKLSSTSIRKAIRDRGKVRSKA